MKRRPALNKAAVDTYKRLIASAAGRAAATLEIPDRYRLRVMSEAHEQRKLTRYARDAWWWSGYQHHRPERADGGEAKRGKGEGVKPGFPDVTVHVPQLGVGGLFAVELKSVNHRPVRQVDPMWWIAWKPDVDPLARSEPTRYGLRWSQAEQLQRLQACGYQTFVAYGADEAFAYLIEKIGTPP